MKIRIQGNSIRLRVTQPELAEMKSTNVVSDAISFGGQSAVTYRLLATQDVSSPEASFDAQMFEVRLPQSTFNQWADSNEISIHGAQNIGGGDELSILVEKDFACLQPREGEDQSEMFANPDAGKVEC
jgi:hypothetical protein